jgi:hypothetical protein
MEGWRRGGLAEREQIHGKKKCKCALTSTGLLMEGLDEINSRYRSQDDLKYKRKRRYQDAVSTQLPISKERDQA